MQVIIPLCCLGLLALLDFQTWVAILLRQPAPDDPPPILGNVFLAATLWNGEEVLRTHWSAAVLDLAMHLGLSRLYVSIYESGSWDNTKVELRKLDDDLARLQIPAQS